MATYTITRAPNSDISVAWARSGGSYNYECVVTNDGDASYIHALAALTDLYGFTPPNLPAGSTITNVRVHTVIRNYPYQADSFQHAIRVNGISYFGSVQTPPDSYTDLYADWALNPNTGLAWTWRDINGVGSSPLQGIGLAKISATFYLYCTQVYIEITYTPLSGSLSLTSILSRFGRFRRVPAGALLLSGSLDTRTFEVRAMMIMGDYLYALVGKSLYKVDKAWTKTKLGDIGTTTGNAWIVGDGTNLCVVDSVKGYSWNGATFAQITFPDTFTPSSLTFQDGYYIVSKGGAARFYISKLNDPITWDPLDYATAEGANDNLVAVNSYNRDLWLLGTESLEVWFNSGASSFPFERYSGGFINIGCKAVRSVAVSDQGVFWLDNHLQVRLGVGINSVVVSTPQIEYQLSLLPNPEAAVGFYYIQKGHGFYQLSIGDPNTSKTLVYDATTKFWHTRASGGLNRRHPAQCYAYFNDLHLIGHYARGHILSLDYNAYTNNGEIFSAIRTAQVIHADRKMMFHGKLEIEFESGVGLAGLQPTAILEWSDDAGKTWSNQHTTSIGTLGEYTKRAIWRRLGKSRSRIYRLTVNDPVKRIILGAHLDVEVGRS